MKSSKTTVPLKVRLDPAAYKAFQKEAAARDLTAPQLLRRVMSEWLEQQAKAK